ncbi:hypothetical protein SCANM124S_01747 [Streptomyces canus]
MRSSAPLFATAAPETVADVAEELVRRRRLPGREFWKVWACTRAVRAASADFRRTRLGLQCPRGIPAAGRLRYREVCS